MNVPADAKFTDNNTTYSFANGTNGFTVTPSGGSAQAVTVTPSFSVGTGDSNGQVKINGTNASVKGLGSAAYTNSNAYAAASHTHSYLPLSGGTLTGQLITSFGGCVAIGSRQSAQTTIPNLIEELRYSSGCMGSFSLNTAYTLNGITIPTRWYNYIYVPHRSGGNSGSASGDNCNYGTLYLSGMTASGFFIIRFAGSIAEVKSIASSTDISTLQSNFQAGVDSVYNAIKAQGTTPASKSLSDVVNGIGTMSTNRYNSGYSNGYSKGVSDADGRSNPSSYNYQTGYNAGYAAGAGAAKTVPYSISLDGDSSGSHKVDITFGNTKVVDGVRVYYSSDFERSGNITY